MSNVEPLQTKKLKTISDVEYRSSIIFGTHTECVCLVLGSNQELLDPRSWLHNSPRTAPASPAPHTRAHLLSSSTSSTSSSKSFCNGEMDMFPPICVLPAPHSAPPIDTTHKISTG